MTLAKQPHGAVPMVRSSQYWPVPLRKRIIAQAAREKRTLASMTAILVERGLSKSEPRT